MSFKTEAEVARIAEFCHEANRGLCVAQGDFSQPHWGVAADWQKDSALKGVRFHLNHPDASPSDSHNSWLAEKERTGWKYGLVKDEVKKEHPCFVPYDHLPPEQRVKDYVFKAVVEAFR